MQFAEGPGVAVLPEPMALQNRAGTSAGAEVVMESGKLPVAMVQ